jgi:hypothetical protein
MPKRKDLVKQILNDLGISEAKLAEMIGYQKANLNYHMKKDDIDLDLFSKIIAKLKEKGITISGDISQAFSGGSGSTTNEGDMTGNFIGEPKEIHYNNNYDQQLIKEISEPYKMAIEAKEQTIQMLKERLVEREKRIDELLDMLKNK